MGHTHELLDSIASWYRTQDRETRGNFLRRTGLNSKSLHDAFRGIRCTAPVAIAIATAYGCSKRWPELVIIKEGS